MSGDVGTVATQIGASKTDERLDVDIVLVGGEIALGNFPVRGAFTAGDFTASSADDVDDGSIGAGELVLIDVGMNIANEVVIGVAGQAAKSGTLGVGKSIIVNQSGRIVRIGFVNIRALETGRTLGAAAGDGVADIDVVATVGIAVVTETATRIEGDVVETIEDGVGARTGDIDTVKAKFVANTKKHSVAVGKGTIFTTNDWFFHGGATNGGF